MFYKELTPDKRVLGTIGLTAPLRNCNIRYLVPCLYMNMVQGLSRNEHNATVIMCVGSCSWDHWQAIEVWLQQQAVLWVAESAQTVLGGGQLLHTTDQHTILLWLRIPRQLWKTRHHTSYWPVSCSLSFLSLQQWWGYFSRLLLLFLLFVFVAVVCCFSWLVSSSSRRGFRLVGVANLVVWALLNSS